MYANGLGVEQDFAEALAIYQQAAEQNNAQAMLNLGMLYVNAQGTPQDLEAAVSNFRAAATLGYAPAQANLAIMYANGLGVPMPSLVDAYMWAQLAAEQNNQQAQAYLQDLESRLSSEQIVEAMEKARVCAESNFSDC